MVDAKTMQLNLSVLPLFVFQNRPNKREGPKIDYKKVLKKYQKDVGSF